MGRPPKCNPCVCGGGGSGGVDIQIVENCDNFGMPCVPTPQSVPKFFELVVPSQTLFGATTNERFCSPRYAGAFNLAFFQNVHAAADTDEQGAFLGGQDGLCDYIWVSATSTKQDELYLTATVPSVVFDGEGNPTGCVEGEDSGLHFYLIKYYCNMPTYAGDAINQPGWVLYINRPYIGGEKTPFYAATYYCVESAVPSWFSAKTFTRAQQLPNGTFPSTLTIEPIPAPF